MSLSILLAEDDPISAKFVSGCLSQVGHTITIASDGEQAWNAFLSGEYCTVIVDWLMPKMDGVDLIRRIAEKSPTTYLIMLTVKDRPEDMILATEAGANEFISKPIDCHELIAKINVAERHHKLNRRLANEAAKRIGWPVAAAWLVLLLVLGGWLLWQARHVSERTGMFHDVVNTNANGVIVCDERAIIYVNDAACEVTGYAADELIGQKATMLVPKHLRGAHERAMCAALLRAKDTRQTVYLKLPIMKKSGELVSHKVQIGTLRRNGLFGSSVYLVARIDRIFDNPNVVYREYK